MTPEENPRPTAVDPDDPADALADAEPETPSAPTDSFAAILAKFASDNGAPMEPADADPSAAAVYMKPILDRLAEIERNLPAFPPKAQGAVAWHVIESEVLDPRSRASIREIGRRHGVSHNSTVNMGKARRWMDRRAAILEIQARKSTVVALLETGTEIGPARRRGYREKSDRRYIDLVDRALQVIEHQLKVNPTKPLPARDLDILIRLAKYLRGEADKIVERRDRITPADLERRARKIAKSMHVDAALAGLVQDADFTVVDGPPDQIGGSSSGSPGGGGSSSPPPDSPSVSPAPPSPSSAIPESMPRSSATQ